MKITIALLIIVCTFLTAIIILNDKAWMYKLNEMEKAHESEKLMQDSTYNVLYERILKHNYKPKKVR